MIATYDVLRKMYIGANKLFFNGMLPNDTPIYLHDSFKVPGRYDYTCDENGKILNQSISISRSFDWDREHLNDVLIHEMIHEYVYWFGLDDGNPHGNIFRDKMNEINEMWSRHVTIDQDLSKMKRAQGTSGLKWWFAKTF